MFISSELLSKAQKEVPNPNVLINMVSKRVKQLHDGDEPLIQSLEKLSLEDLALREIIEKKITADS